MTRVLTFDGQPPRGTINLSIGQPSADLLPVDLVGAASHKFFDIAQPLELNYGVLEGDGRFLDSLAMFLTENYDSPTIAEQLFVTGGNSQGMDLASFVFANAGDTVFVEEPSYFLAFQIFRDHGLEIVGIPTDEDGLCIDSLRQALELHKPAFLYTIPSYHNPGGHCTSEERRRAIVELACEKDFLIVADEVYQLLYYSQPPPPAYGTMTDSDKIVSLGSFSKILAPGLRLGWIQTSERLRKKILAAGIVNSGGSLNHISSHIVRQSIDDGSLHVHIRYLRQAYRKRVEAMDEALREHFGDIARWKRPDGGYFFWVRCDESVDTGPLRDEARRLRAGFLNGAIFSTAGAFSNCLRLCFAHYGENDIHEGIARIRPLFE
jgi:DNA-binding transcriptional MocR family regulator